MNTILSHILTLLLALFLSNTAASADTGLTRLGEFKVNTTTAGDQRSASVACAPDGRFVVAWTNVPDSGIYFQRYNAAGSPEGGETKANTNPARVPDAPSVAMDDKANFVLAWVKESDGNGTGIAFRQFDSNGVALGLEIPVGVDNLDQLSADVAMQADGKFAIGWFSVQSDLRAYVQFYNASGSALGGPVQLNPSGIYDSTPVIGARPKNGGYIVVWRFTAGGGNTNVLFQQFDATGNRVGGPGQVDASDAGEQDKYTVASAEDNSFVIAYSSDVGDGSGNGIYAQRYDKVGAKIGGTFPVNTATSGDQILPCAVFDSAGTFVVGYRSFNFDGSGQAFVAQRFNFSDATKLGDEFLVNTFPTGDQAPPEATRTISADAAGNLVFVWTSDGQDGSSGGIYAEKFYQPNQGPPLTEFRVNQATTGNQTNPAVASDPAGNYVVVWQSEPQAGGARTVFGRLYFANGLPRGDEFPVSTVLGDHTNPAAAMDISGNFVVVWSSAGGDGDGRGIKGRRFNANGGTPVAGLAGEFIVNLTTAGDSDAPQVAMRPTGEFVVAWVNYVTLSNRSIFGRRYTAAGAAIPGEVVIQDTTDQLPNGAGISLFTNGDFVVAWRRNKDVVTQVFDGSNGNPKSVPVLVTHSGSAAFAPDAATVTVNSDGGFTVVWEDGSSSFDVYGRRYAADTTALTNYFPVSVANSGEQSHPSIAATPNGGSLVVFRSPSLSGDGFDVALQQVPSSGIVASTEVRVNQTSLGDQIACESSRRAVATDSFGNYVVVWTSQQGQDGSGEGVYATKVITATPDVVAAAPTLVSAAGGTLRVTFSTVPVGGTARWRLAGAADWRTTDLGGLEPGDYLVEFEPVGGVAAEARVVTVQSPTLPNGNPNPAGNPTIALVAYPPASTTTAPLTGAVSVTIKPDKEPKNVAGNAVVQFRGQWRPAGTAGSLTADFALNPFGPLAGNFGTLLRQDVFDAQTSGAVALKLGKTGAFSGKITLVGVSYTMKGKLTGSGEATTVVSRGKGKGTLTFSQRIAALGTDARLSGTITSTDGSVGSAPVRYTFEALRQSYSKKNPAPMAGKWTVALPSDPAHAGDAATAYPKGHGFGALTIAANGDVRGALTLGDGTPISAGSYVDGNRKWQFYAAPYKAPKPGAFIGELVFAQTTGQPGAGVFDWSRPAVSKPGIFQSGFTGQTSAVASQWNPPAKGAVALAINGWDFLPGTLALKAALDTANHFTLTPPSTATLKLSATTGLLSGKFTPAGETKAVPFKGALLQQRMLGRGLFVKPDKTNPVTLDPP